MATTFGFNETEKLKVTYGPSRRTPDLQVMHLSYPDTDASRSAAGCIKSSAALIALMAVVLGLIVGLVVGIGQLRSMFSVSPTKQVAIQSSPTQSIPKQPVTKRTNPADPAIAKSIDQSQSIEPVTSVKPASRQPTQQRPPRTPFPPPGVGPRAPFPSGPRFSPMPSRPSSQPFPPAMVGRDSSVDDSNTARNSNSEPLTDWRPPAVVIQSRPLESPPLTLTYSADGKHLAVSTRGHLRIFDAKTVRELALGKTDAPFGRLVSVAFDRQNRFVVAGNGRGQFRWWELATQDDQSLAMGKVAKRVAASTNGHCRHDDQRGGQLARHRRSIRSAHVATDQ